MINKLYPYQENAVNEIEEKFNDYLRKTPVTGFKDNLSIIPFICSLKSITGSGKTAMLSLIAYRFLNRYKNSLVLWLSQSKVVVEQTFNNLSVGGKYNFLLPKVEIYSLSQLRSTLPDTDGSIIYLATTGTFNVNSKEGRLIYDSGEDEGNFSGWELLKQRIFDGEKRELFIIYDEGHHLTEQQINRLLELEPTGIILASGTPKYSKRLARLIEQAQWKDEDLIVKVPTSEVVSAGLIKDKLRIIGYDVSMEEIVNSLVADLNKLNKLAKQKGLPKLKAIYVCKTNLLETDNFQKDNLELPFVQRKAPPILIWLHLVKRLKINPEKIAICARVDFKKPYLPDPNFKLFAGQDKKSDYQAFLAGQYEHIIFNKGLLEGWDDPSVYIAYIDRSIGSDIQAEQLIGRVLRMPQACHYEQNFEDLNTAFFHIKLNDNTLFKEIVERVKEELENIAPEIKSDFLLSSEKNKLIPCLTRKTKYVPKIAIMHEDKAKLVIQSILQKKVKDYSQSPLSFIEPQGKRSISEHQIGNSSPVIIRWEKFANYNKVSVRTTLRRSILKINSRVLDLTDLNHEEYKRKLDFLIGCNSGAEEELKKIAQEIVDNYMGLVKLTTVYDQVKKIPDINVNQKIWQKFDNSVHQYYSDLNPLELETARVIDSLGLDWTRNPVFSGYGIPLLSKGFTKRFYPDFLVWLDDDKVFAIETTGKGLLDDKLDRKLFAIESFSLEEARKHSQMVPPSKVIVGVITTTKVWGEYKVYRMDNNGKQEDSEIMDMEGCVREILGKI